MQSLVKVARGGVLLAFLGWVGGCVVAPAEGYYDRDHHRYYHEHAWHECGEHNDFCR
jgi:hypothetical protein